MRRRGQKLNAYADALVSAVTRKHDPALLFFLCQWIHQHNRFPVVHFVTQHQQAAVDVYHHRLAHFPEFPSVVRAPPRLQPHLVKDALAAAGRGKCRLVHVLIMESAAKPVNCPSGQVSSKRHSAFGGWECLGHVIVWLIRQKRWLASLRVFA